MRKFLILSLMFVLSFNTIAYADSKEENQLMECMISDLINELNSSNIELSDGPYSYYSDYVFAGPIVSHIKISDTSIADCSHGQARGVLIFKCSL